MSARGRLEVVITALLVTLGGCESEPEGGEGPVERAVEAKQAERAAETEDPHRIDRLGRMEITNTYLQHDKVSYNQEDPFSIEDTHLAVYRKTLATNLHIFDMMDGVDNWTPDGGPNPLTEMLLRDFLIVDVSKPCTVDSRSYLDIEKATFEGREYTTCGGRAPNDVALDVMLTLVINGMSDVPWRTDGVEGATQPSVDTFPYLAPPNP